MLRISDNHFAICLLCGVSCLGVSHEVEYEPHSFSIK